MEHTERTNLAPRAPKTLKRITESEENRTILENTLPLTLAFLLGIMITLLCAAIGFRALRANKRLLDRLGGGEGVEQFHLESRNLSNTIVILIDPAEK